MRHQSDMAALADALGDVRARIKALKSEEAKLRRAILDARPNGPVSGRGYCVDVRVRTSRRFDAKLLPEAIRNDPAYCKVTETRTVITNPAGDARSKRCAPSVAKDEEFDVFERD